MITPELERAGQVEVPIQGALFLGDGSPMALRWAEGELPLAGRQIANRPENSCMWYKMVERQVHAPRMRRFEGWENFSAGNGGRFLLSSVGSRQLIGAFLARF
jgi:hypothetical protein